MQEEGKARRGFASMAPEKKRKIASMGGKAAQALGTAHKWTREEAAEAGKIGGRISKRGPSKEGGKYEYIDRESDF